MDFFGKVYGYIKDFCEFLWIVLELHLPKVILLIGFFIGINEVSVMHILIIVLATAAATSKSQMQSFMTRVISLVIGILFILKMVYQIEYINHSQYNVVCDVSLCMEEIMGS